MDRIDFIASLTKGLESVCDIGCDHAYTLINAVNKYGVLKGYGLDIADGPLEAAKKNIEEANLSDKISLVKSNGIESFDTPVEGVVISGMGGLNIVDIISYDIDYFKNTKRIILSAHNDMPKLRFFLINHMFNIEGEYMIEENNHIYEIIVLNNEKVTRKYDYYDMNFGPILRKEKPELFVKKYTRLLNNVNEALKNAKDLKEITKLKFEKTMYEEVLK